MLFSLSRVALHRLTDLGFSDHTVLRLMRLYDNTCVALCEGQYLDIWMAEHDDGLSVELYFDMIGRKTAALISASIEAGAVLATEDEAVIDRYRAFGWDLGIAFQLNDDLLGIWGREDATGKEPTDVPRKKKTLPIIYAFEHGTDGDRARLTALYANGRLTPQHVAEIVAILERTGAREYTRDQARLHRDRALAALDAAGTLEREPRERLEEIVRSVINA
jgi:geranylgeranyl diphosphate synthase type I